MKAKSATINAISTWPHIGHCVGQMPWKGNSQQITGISSTPTVAWYS